MSARPWWVDSYRAHLTGAGLAARTIYIYERKVHQAQEWCGNNGLDLASLDAIQLRALAESFPRSHSTLRHLRASLAHYYDMVGYDAPLRAIKPPKKPHYRNRALSVADARLLAKAARYRIPEGLAVGFGLYMALRVSEIASVQWSRFDDHQTWYSVLGKGDETYTLPVHPVLRDDLKYVKRATDFVFGGSRGRDHVTAATVWGWTREVCREAGIDEVSPHVLRHTAITTAHDKSKDLRTVSRFARHERLETTRLYTRTTDEQLIRVVLAINYEED
jgi:integrase